jgi:hypothetical protein
MRLILHKIWWTTCTSSANKEHKLMQISITILPSMHLLPTLKRKSNEPAVHNDGDGDIESQGHHLDERRWDERRVAELPSVQEDRDDAWQWVHRRSAPGSWAADENVPDPNLNKIGGNRRCCRLVVRTPPTWVLHLGPSAAEDTLAWSQLRVPARKAVQGRQGSAVNLLFAKSYAGRGREDGRASIANKSRA